jgi:VanZ family protein
MTLVARRIDLWLPPIALMGVIFFLSAQPNLSSGLGAWDLILRKIGHAGIFALLFLLWWRALRPLGGPRRVIAAAWIVTVGYAVSDEWHQSFIDGRHGSPVDVLIDTAGASVAALFAARRS